MLAGAAGFKGDAKSRLLWRLASRIFAEQGGDHRPKENGRAQYCRYRIAGHAEHALVAPPAIHQWFARPHGDMVEADLEAGCLQGATNEIVISDGGPADSEKNIGLCGPADAGRKTVHAVACDAEGKRLAAGIADQGAECRRDR
jgi:hypothetical protein